MMVDPSATAPPAMVAFRFLGSAIGDGNLAPVWQDVDPILRLSWAQLWISNTGHLDRFEEYERELVTARIVAGIQGIEWDVFEPWMVDSLRYIVPAPFRPPTWGIGSNPRFVAPNVELLYLHQDNSVWEPDTSRVVVPIMMRISGDAWQVLNVGYELIPEPGWPPTLAPRNASH